MSEQERQAAVRAFWASGDYTPIGDLFAGAGRAVVERVGVSGSDVLDVATGTGNTALAAARAGARRVVGVDVTPELLEVAAARAQREGLDVEWLEGDLHALPVADAAFDRVLSTFGVMLAADQRTAAAELVRSCRPGGRIALTAWATDSIFRRWSEVVEPLLPDAPAGPAVDDWASADGLRTIFAGLPVTVTVEPAALPMRFASVEAALELFEQKAAPIIAARRTLEQVGRWSQARAAFGEMLAEADTATDGSTTVAMGYVTAVLDRS